MQGSDDESEEDEGPGAEAMAGLRIRHKAEDLAEGDAVIMTLADRNILDERGELDEDEDILEESLLVRPLQACPGFFLSGSGWQAVCGDFRAG